MKNIYPKSKGKIHPSPPASTSVTADALAVLKLLPAAIAALASALGDEEKEVLAYLIAHSIAGGERRRCRRSAGFHHWPAFDCGCFDCYTSFWSRWDGSPNREVIHEVIEGFEDHLARSEAAKGGGRAGRRRQQRRAEEENKVTSETAAPASAPVVDDEEFDVDEATPAMEAVEESEMMVVAGGERRWTDVMGLFNSRLWNLWSPAV